MSKVFEEEYRQLAENDIPDLWNRIEAGLQARTVEASPIFRAEEATDHKASDPDAKRPPNSGPDPDAKRTPSSSPDPDDRLIPNIRSSPEPRTKIISIRNISKYAGLVAACLCAVVIIPAAINTVNKNTSDSVERITADSSTEAAPMAEATTDEMEPAEPPAAEMESAAGQMVENSKVAEDMSAAEQNKQEEAVATDEMAESPEMEEVPEMAEEMDNFAQTDGFTYAEDSIDMELVRKYYAGILTEGEAVKGVTLEVTSGELSESVMVYYAVVREDPNLLFKQGDPITFVKDPLVESDIAVGGIYQVDLNYQKDASYVFEVDKIIN